VAKVIAGYYERGGLAAACSAEALAKIGMVCKKCRHCSTYWESRGKKGYVPVVIQGTGVEKK
jgi:hypothetical protein